MTLISTDTSSPTAGPTSAQPKAWNETARSIDLRAEAGYSTKNGVEKGAHNTGSQDRERVPSTSENDTSEIRVWFSALKTDDEC